MKNKIQNFWYSLGVNTKSILITAVVLLGVFCFLGILYLFTLYPLVGMISMFTLVAVFIFRVVRAGVIENQVTEMDIIHSLREEKLLRERAGVNPHSSREDLEKARTGY